ncbi:MAG: ABC transporter substrate-binding protein [Polyangiaceae bacterium]
MSSCTSKNDPALVSAAIEHLNAIGAASVMFTNASDVKAALPQLLKYRMLAVCTGCDPALFASTETGGLLFNMVPDYGPTVNPLVSRWVRDMEARIRAGSGPVNGTKLRLLYLSPKTPSAAALEKTIAGTLTVNGMSVAQQADDFRYLDVPVNAPDFAEVAGGIASFRPDIVLLAADGASLTEYLPRIEGAWPADVAKPQYMLLSNSTKDEDIIHTVGGNEDLRKRVTGFRVSSSYGTQSNYEGFVTRYRSKYGLGAPSSGASYEAFYFIGHAIAAASVRATEVAGRVSGRDAALQIPFITDPSNTRIIDVSPSGFFDGLLLLYSREYFRLRGTHWDFAFDYATGAQTSDAFVYCPVRDDQGGLVMKAAIVYRRATKSLVAAFDPGICAW